MLKIMEGIGVVIKWFNLNLIGREVLWVSIVFYVEEL